jgi:hypothetical protein
MGIRGSTPCLLSRSSGDPSDIIKHNPASEPSRVAAENEVVPAGAERAAGSGSSRSFARMGPDARPGRRMMDRVTPRLCGLPCGGSRW